MKRPQRRGVVVAIRVFAGLVWLVFGLVFKVLGVMPHHREIVASVLGEGVATPATIAIGLLECALGLWVMSGIYPRTCAGVQTVAIAAMNTLELILARHILLSPILMVCANIIFLSLIWYSALQSTRKP